jgi:hypothetical protein
MQKYMPLSLLGVNTISEASVCVCLSDGGTGGGGGGGVTAGAVMITAFERKAATFTSPIDSLDSAQGSLPLHRNERTERVSHSEAPQGVALHTADSSCGDSAAGSTYEGDGEGAVCVVSADPAPATLRKRAGWSFAPPYPLPLSGRMRDRDSDEERDDSESGSNTFRASLTEEYPHDIEHGPRERQEGESLYSDPSVPLSLFLQDGVLPQAPHDGDPAARRKMILPPPTLQKDADKIKSDAKEKEKEKEKASLGKAKGSWEAPSKDKSGKLVDLPVIFQPQLRSSGYGQGQGSDKKPILVRRQSSSAGRMSDRSTGTSSSSGSGSKSQTSSGSSGSRIRIYPGTCDPMSLHQAYNDYPLLSSSGTSPCLPPISSISFRYEN